MRKLRERPLQVYLRPDQDATLRAMAKQENVALAELVRRGVDRLISDIPPEHDPLMNLIGIGNSGIRDLSENHDKYIIEALLAESQPPSTSAKDLGPIHRKPSSRRKARQKRSTRT